MNWKAEALAFALSALAVGLHWLNAYIKSHFKPRQLAAVFDLARTAVSAAQEFGAPTDLGGADKFTFATNALVAGAKKVGIKLTDPEATSFVHAALRELKESAAALMPVTA